MEDQTDIDVNLVWAHYPQNTHRFLGGNMPKTWVEKRDCGKTPHTKVLHKPFAGIPSGYTMLISSPQEIDEFIRQLPRGTTVSPLEMRKSLAKKHKADATCPVSTGIFFRIVCEAAIEERNQNTPLAEITPFWRVDLEGTSTASKLSIDKDELKLLRASER